ncbi:hypothetical protein AB0D99_32725 [Streptomyces sp. NPDC047971]|uniref:hypothetical protein n=1 Tax=Streptomyces sp. NPDC047971 TaxID=3154499 RepID=UPI0033C7FB13
MLRKATAILGSLGMAAAFLVIGAPAASAGGYGCAGGQIATYPVKYGSTTYGNIYVYYDASTGKNCAVNVATTAGGYGKDKYMQVEITRCSETSPSSTCHVEDEDYEGYYPFKYYAGPVEIYASNKCINVSGEIKYNGNTATGTNYGADHCG